MSKYLIINADDFGYNDEQNEAIKDLLQSKLITSTSLMSVAPKAGEAIEFAKEKGFSLGVHLTINSDDECNKWQSLTGAKSLGADGFPANQKNLMFKAKRKDVKSELDAQYRFITDNCAAVDHADNHCGTLYGINGRRFFMDAFDFCSDHNLPFRFPKTSGFLERQLGLKIPSAILKLQKAIVSQGEKRGVQLLDDLVSDPRPFDKIKTYESLREYYLNAVDNCLEGITEMFLHPAKPNEKLGKEWQKRVFEYELLRSGDLLERAKERDIQVVSWDIFKDIKSD